MSPLPAIFQSIVIPPAAAAEITPSIPALPPWLHVEGLKQPLCGLVLQRSLGAGEREALALAVEIRAERILLDDLPARDRVPHGYDVRRLFLAWRYDSGMSDEDMPRVLIRQMAALEPEPDDTHARRQSWFRRNLANGPLWHSQATELMLLADLAWQQLESHWANIKTSTVDDNWFMKSRLVRPFYLVAGLAIENFLKATIVLALFKRNDGSVDDSIPVELPREIFTHDLVRLVAKTGVQLSEEQLVFAQTLSQMVRWQGRYPVPVKVEPLTGKELGGLDPLRGYTSSNRDGEILKSIVAAIETKYAEHQGAATAASLERHLVQRRAMGATE